MPETFADTAAIRALGHTNAAAADNLAAIAARLSALPGTAAAEVFGPVGAEFLAALADAAADASRVVAELGDRLAWALTAAHASAEAYDATDDHAAHLLAVGR
jgi:hypothetical protein